MIKINRSPRAWTPLALAIACGALALLWPDWLDELRAQGYNLMIPQNFDTDPGWTRFNNPANSNDFGFQDSNLAGGDPKRWRRNIRKVHYWRG